MRYVVELMENYRPDRNTLIMAGPYRVPEDMTDEMAERAIAHGAKRIEMKAKGAAPENKLRASRASRNKPADA
jgi:hypothetical protein